MALELARTSHRTGNTYIEERGVRIANSIVRTTRQRERQDHEIVELENLPCGDAKS